MNHGRRTTLACALATAGLVGGLATASANAATQPSTATTRVTYIGCDKAGFSGRIRVTQTGANVTVAYAIEKHGVSGGNSANVYVNDNGVAPTKKFGMNNGIQDGAYRTMARYTRGFGGISVQFTFDLTNVNPDPACGAVKSL